MPKHDHQPSGHRERNSGNLKRSRSVSSERIYRKQERKDSSKHRHEHARHSGERRRSRESDRSREHDRQGGDSRLLPKREKHARKELDSPKPAAEPQKQLKIRDDSPPKQTGEGKPESALTTQPAVTEKEKPNLAPSGNLLKDTNTFRGVVLKYAEPQNAHMPATNRRYRLYPFKGDSELPCLYIHRQSAYMIGRDRQIADIPVDHPSCSKQHAVIQYRLVNEAGDDDAVNAFARRVVKPYIIDLESANGTFLNETRIDPRRFYELRDKDVVRFGFSTRSYVVLSESFNDAGVAESSADGLASP